MTERQQQQERRYRGTPYWEKEPPEVAQTDRIRLSYYPKAGKLQVCQLYRDKETGEIRPGKTVTLDSEDLQLHPEAKELLARFIEEIER